MKVPYAKKWQKETDKQRKIPLDCDLTEEFKWGKPCFTFQEKRGDKLRRETGSILTGEADQDTKEVTITLPATIGSNACIKAVSQPSRSTKRPKPVVSGRLGEALSIAEQQGLLSGSRTLVVRGRMPNLLVEQAKMKSGIQSDSKLIEAALANIVVADDYAEWLLAQRGTVTRVLTYRIDPSRKQLRGATDKRKCVCLMCRMCRENACQN